MDIPILSYGLAPDIVFITLADQNPSQVSLQFTAKNNSADPASIQKIVIALSDLCDSYGGITTHPEILGPQSSTWSCASPLNDGTFTLLPKPIDQDLPTAVVFKPGQELVIELKNLVVSSKPGAATVRFEETSSAGTATTMIMGLQKVRPSLSAMLLVSPESRIIECGGTAILQWKTVGATSGRLSWTVQYGIGSMIIDKNQLPKGQYSFNPILRDTTFRLDCHGQETEIDVTAEASVSVYMPMPPKIKAFQANPQEFYIHGGKVTLSWELELPPGLDQEDYLKTLELDVAPDVGRVNGLTSIQIDVNKSTTYTLTAKNSRGEQDTKEAKVTIIPRGA
jgi:hypothetical protein